MLRKPIKQFQPSIPRASGTNNVTAAFSLSGPRRGIERSLMASNHQLATALILYRLLINYLKLPEGVLSATPQIVYNCLLHYIYTSGIKCLGLLLPVFGLPETIGF